MLSLESGTNRFNLNLEHLLSSSSVTAGHTLAHSPPSNKQLSPTKLSFVLLVSFKGLGLGRVLVSLYCLKISSTKWDYNTQDS